MGCCASNDDSTTKLSLDIPVNPQIRLKQDSSQTPVKILFLGPGGCGKSTLFRQLRHLYGTKVTDKDKSLHCDYIHTFLIETMQNILNEIDTNDLSLDATKYVSLIENLHVQSRITQNIASAIKCLWNENSVQTVFKKQSKLLNTEACAYFFENVEVICSLDFIPELEDILRHRRPTTGLIEQILTVNGRKVYLFDTGGEKNERRKWEHCFENVSSVVFVASLACYNKVLFEDETKNSMKDCLELFYQICCSKWFLRQDMILFLTKMDLFEKKIKAGVELKECSDFEDYKGIKGDIEESLEYIKGKFRQYFQQSKNELRKLKFDEDEIVDRRKLYIEVVSGYNTNKLKEEFEKIVNIVQY